ncbi:MAG: transglycosylase domain-containing protein [Bacteroidia bacterium]
MRELIMAWRALPTAEAIERPIRLESTRVYTADGALMARFHDGENREEVPLDAISHHVIDALVATEDKRFYEHGGVDGEALPAAVYRNIFTGRTTGASTITMQLARNLYPEVGKAKSFRRKLREAMTAIWLERHYTKDELIHAYLNTVNIYSNCYGIETASKRLFAKSAIDLDEGESAFLVGLLKGQGRYNPRARPESAKRRRNVVLRLMQDQGYIGQAVYDSLSTKPIQLAELRENQKPEIAPYFREYLRDWLEDWAKANGHDAYRDGLTIVTTIDSAVQAKAVSASQTWLKEIQGVFDKHIKGKEAWRKEKDILTRLMRQSRRHYQAYKKGFDKEAIEAEFNTPVEMRIFSWDGPIDTVMTPMDSLKYYCRFLEVGLCAMDPVSGEIKAWVGGIDHNFFKYDHVELGRRQTGSSFKPFVYGAAIEGGYLPCKEFLNQRVESDYKNLAMSWSPENVNKSVGGFITLRQALAKSVNIISARVTKDISPQRVVDFAHDLGIESPIQPYPSICLGVTELSVMEMTNAYCTYAHEGQRMPPVFVKEIRDRDGKVIFSSTPNSHQAISSSTAYAMVDMLRGSMGRVSGIRGKIRTPDNKNVDIGGKTGTTQNNSDGWFMGITPGLVAGVWVGCGERQMRFRTTRLGQGAYMAKPIWTRFMQKVYADKATAPARFRFTAPEDFDIPLRCVPTRRANPYEVKAGERPKGMSGW